jgi:AraC-like DNA-binding protein
VGGVAVEPFGAFRVVRTSEIDEAQDAMQSVFLPLRLRLPKPDGSRWRLDMTLNATRVGEVTIAYVQMGRDVQVDTVEAENYHVNLPLSGSTCSRSGRLEPVRTTPARAAVFMPGLPAEIEWHGGSAQFCLMFPRHVLRQELEEMLDRPVSASISFAPAMDVTSGARRAWADVLGLIERQTSYRNSLLDHPLAVGTLQRMLVEGLLLGQPHNYSEALAQPDRPVAPRAVRQAMELIRDRPDQPWTTAVLARSVAVSARSLQDGFARSIGVSPMRYLREVRLDRVHADLRSADPQAATVSQVAGRWGFVYLSRFAAAYREKFGENPSQTLHNA